MSSLERASAAFGIERQLSQAESGWIWLASLLSKCERLRTDCQTLTE